MFTHLAFFLVSSLFLVSVSGDPFRTRIDPNDVKVSNATEVYKHVMSVIKTPDVRCPEGQMRDRLGKCRAVFRRSVPDDPECDGGDGSGNCPRSEIGENCADGEGCGEAAMCEGESCPGDGEVMLRMEEEKSGRRHKTKKGRDIVLILKKKKVMKPFLKPKPKPHPPPYHHHHSSEEEEEGEPDEGDLPDPPELRMFNGEICVEEEDGTTGNCIGSTEVPEISGQNEKSPGQGARRPKAAESPDLKKVIRFLKVLRMRRRLDPVLGRFFHGTKRGSTERQADERLRR